MIDSTQSIILSHPLLSYPTHALSLSLPVCLSRLSFVRMSAFPSSLYLFYSAVWSIKSSNLPSLSNQSNQSDQSNQSICVCTYHYLPIHRMIYQSSTYIHLSSTCPYRSIMIYLSIYPSIHPSVLSAQLSTASFQQCIHVMILPSHLSHPISTML